jgi:hypothetical protein
MYEAIEIRNARNLMYALYARGEITLAEYWTWKEGGKDRNSIAGDEDLNDNG